MRISPVNYSVYTKNQYSLNNTKKMPSFSSAENEKQEEINLYEFRQEYAKSVLNKLNERKEEIYKYLDSAKFDNGETVIDRIAGMFDMQNIEITTRKLSHKTSGNNTELIEQNGFDPKKINITNFGPGFYFNGEEFYSGITLHADYEGRTATGRKMGEYESINGDISYLIRKQLQLPQGYSNHRDIMMRMGESDAAHKFTHEYVRHVIVDTLGIDGAEAENTGRYFVVFNPDTIKNIRH